MTHTNPQLKKFFTPITAWVPLFISFLLPIWAIIDFISYRQVFQNEIHGLSELVHALFPLASAVIVIWILVKYRTQMDKLIFVYLCIMAAG
ncbi:MAG: hypothetical protein AAFO68_10885, partial [Pseudomonadota bacterium]